MKKFSLILISVLLISSCATKTYRMAAAQIQQTKTNIQQAQNTADETAPPVVINSGYYVNTKPTRLEKTPRWLLKRVILKANNIPFAMAMNNLLRHSNAGVSYDNSVEAQNLININYSGTIKGALDRLAQQTHYSYRIENKEIIWSAFMTKTFNIAFMPGSSNYLVGQAQGGNENNHSPAYGGGIVVASSGMHDQQYSNLRGELSVWNDIRRTLNNLKSREGKVFVSESTSSVTVSDHPGNLYAMEKYIGELNRSLSKEVGVKIHVLDVELNNDYNSGIDWNAIIHALGTKFQIMGNLAAATNPLSSNIITDNMASPLATFKIGTNEMPTLISALSRQGKISLVTQPQVVTINNQIASIRITQNTGYIESVSSTTFGNNNNFITSSITPGSVTDGFTLYLLPRISGKNVFMQISSTISNLLSLQKESTSSGENQQFNAIEVPTIAEKAFNIRSVVRSGKTLVIAGFKSLINRTESAKMFGISALGGKGASKQNVETLILITPIILQSTGQWNGNNNT